MREIKNEQNNKALTLCRVPDYAECRIIRLVYPRFSDLTLGIIGRSL